MDTEIKETTYYNDDLFDILCNYGFEKDVFDEEDENFNIEEFFENLKEKLEKKEELEEQIKEDKETNEIKDELVVMYHIIMNKENTDCELSKDQSIMDMIKSNITLMLEKFKMMSKEIEKLNKEIEKLNEQKIIKYNNYKINEEQKELLINDLKTKLKNEKDKNKEGFVVTYENGELFEMVNSHGFDTDLYCEDEEDFDIYEFLKKVKSKMYEKGRVNANREEMELKIKELESKIQKHKKFTQFLMNELLE